MIKMDWNNVLMVQEAIILLRIQHLQQRTGRVSIVSPAYFIHFIDQNERIFGLHAFQRLYNLTRQSTTQNVNIGKNTRKMNAPDIGSPVTFYLSDISQATYTKSEELSAQRASDAFANRRFTNARWSDETNYFPLDCSSEYTNSKEL